MEENVKQVEVEEVEVIKVEDKKNWLSKRNLVIGGGVIALAVAGFIFKSRNKDRVDENYIVIDNNETAAETEAVETDYTEVVE